MWVLANLAYLSILFCAVLLAAPPGLAAVLPMWDSAYVSGTVTSHGPRHGFSSIIIAKFTDHYASAFSIKHFTLGVTERERERERERVYYAEFKAA